MARTVYEGFEVFVKRLIPTQAQRDAGSGHRVSVKAALESRIAVRNFFETGSFSHGTGVRGYSDIDALVSINESRPESSYTALNWVKDALSARFPYTVVKIRRPAVVVEFGGGTRRGRSSRDLSPDEGGKTSSSMTFLGQVLNLDG